MIYLLCKLTLTVGGLKARNFIIVEVYQGINNTNFIYWYLALQVMKLYFLLDYLPLFNPELLCNCNIPVTSR